MSEPWILKVNGQPFSLPLFELIVDVEFEIARRQAEAIDALSEPEADPDDDDEFDDSPIPEQRVLDILDHVKSVLLIIQDQEEALEDAPDLSPAIEAVRENQAEMLGDLSVLGQLMDQHDVEPPIYDQWLSQQIQAEAAMAQLVDDLPDLELEDLRALWNSQAVDFSQTPVYRIEMLVIHSAVGDGEESVAAKISLLKQARDRLNAGASLVDAADFVASQNLAPSSRRHVDIPLEIIHELFEGQIGDVGPGSLIGPFEIEDGYFIVQVGDAPLEEKPTFEVMVPYLADAADELQVKEFESEFFTRIESHADIEYNEPALREIIATHNPV